MRWAAWPWRPGWGLFGHFRQTQENNNGARLEKLETLADTYETTKAVAMPTPAVPVTGDTMYDKLLLEQYSHTFELTLDQAYCDGHKLYYSYTLRRNAPMAATYGEGEPTGDFNYTWVEEGKTANDCMTLEGEERRGLRITRSPTSSLTASASATARARRTGTI